MSNQLEITRYYHKGSWVVKAKVLETSDEGFPRDVFLWTLDDDGSLGTFRAIGHVDEVSKYPEYSVERTSNFGVHLVKYTESTQVVPTEEDSLKVVTVLKSAFSKLLSGWETVSTPVIEVYP